MNKRSDGEFTNQNKMDVKPSRWWILYHLWAGACAKVYLDVSGLLKLTMGEPIGSDPSSAFSYSIVYALLVILIFSLGYYLSLRIIKLINNSKIPRSGVIILKIILPLGYFESPLVS